MSAETTTTAGLTVEDLRSLLLAVGLSPAAAPHAADRSFDELDLDSLARTELASRIQDRFGVDVEEDVTGELSPAGLRELVNARIGGRA